jgi:hypothetical protein
MIRLPWWLFWLAAGVIAGVGAAQTGTGIVGFAVYLTGLWLLSVLAGLVRRGSERAIGRAILPRELREPPQPRSLDGRVPAETSEPVRRAMRADPEFYFRVVESTGSREFEAARARVERIGVAALSADDVTPLEAEIAWAKSPSPRTAALVGASDGRRVSAAADAGRSPSHRLPQWMVADSPEYAAYLEAFSERSTEPH